MIEPIDLTQEEAEWLIELIGCRLGDLEADVLDVIAAAMTPLGLIHTGAALIMRQTADLIDIGACAKRHRKLGTVSALGELRGLERSHVEELTELIEVDPDLKHLIAQLQP